MLGLLRRRPKEIEEIGSVRSRLSHAEHDPQDVGDGAAPAPRSGLVVPPRGAAKGDAGESSERRSLFALIAKAPQEESVSVDLSSISVLSASGDLYANKEQMPYVCLLSDGRLLIAKGHENHKQVLSYVNLLMHKKVQFRPIRTNIRVIEHINHRGEGVSKEESARSHTEMQSVATKLLQEATYQRASDIHIRVDRRGADILLRVTGDVEVHQEHKREFGEALIRYYYQAMADLSEETFKETMRLDARIGDRTKLPEGVSGIRIATTPTDQGNLMVLRLLYDDASGSLDVRQLGYTEAQRDMLDYMQDQPIGLQIISGPTGSGKSTTLQRVLRHYIHKTGGRKHVITVEDPPEYPIPGAVQTPVGNASSQQERESMFIAAITSAMRLDPDTIMIGEVRDLPSAQLALRAATTGHQVWTTLHANGALPIVSRLVNLGIEPELLLDHTILTGLISQRLVKRLCDHCKEPLEKHLDHLSAPVVERLHKALGAGLKDAYVTGKGCDHSLCRGGTSGRTVVAEIVTPDAKLCQLLLEGKRNDAFHYWMKHLQGMTLVEHAIDKVRRGEVDPLMAERIVGHLHMAQAL